ncbi:hypothetical protein Pint_06941 [Pistacia integerrima]|uniref:Uncharacterized protein n=1 Tax=Pistacia integerrima TaxID=434235 RepID=A0ACC0XXB1_9ROSI|nr:hypothetical protein Pint_06941 [Pistacia integerrima]
MDRAIFEDLYVVIVGGGICGLATALALHRKGMKSEVMERSEALRVSGFGAKNKGKRRNRDEEEE